MEIKQKHMIEEMKSELHQCTGKLLGGKKKNGKKPRGHALLRWANSSCVIHEGFQK